MLTRFDLDFARKTFSPWLDGSSITIELPIYFRRERTRSKSTEKLDVDRDAVLVVEGVISGAIDPGVRSHLVLAVIDAERRRAMRFRNEYQSRSWSHSAIENIYRQRGIDENVLIDSWIEGADFVVDMHSVLDEQFIGVPPER